MTYQEKEKIKAMQQQIDAIIKVVALNTNRIARLETQDQKEKSKSRVKSPPQKQCYDNI